MDNYQDYVHLIGQKMDVSDLFRAVDYDLDYYFDNQLSLNHNNAALKDDMIELGLLDGSEDCWDCTEVEITEEFLKWVLMLIDNKMGSISLGGGYALFATTGMILNKAIFGK